MRYIILGTAGHIDHGKSSLVKALTGIDPDRLKEEKERGITIDIGFADLAFPDAGITVGIVDVPGHEKLIRNMLAGAGGIDMVLLVIAADEGIMPQSREHLAICDMLKIKSGLIALTKADLVEKEWLQLVQDEVKAFVKGTFLEGAPIIPVSSRTGENLDLLKEKIEKIALTVSPKTSEGLFRLPIDRVFTLKGFGTVITGTAISGRVSVEEQIEILPSNIRTKVRGLHSHGKAIETAFAGQRVAINLQGVEKDDLRRGDVAVTPTRFRPTRIIDAFLELLTGVPLLKSKSLIHFYSGTSETVARVILYEKDELKPGESCYCQLRLQEPVIVMSGDRYIIRRFSPLETLGGGDILDPAPFRRRRKDGIDDLKTLHTGTLDERLSLKIEKTGASGLTAHSLEGWINDEPHFIAESLDRLRKAGAVLRYEDVLLHRKAVLGIQGKILELLKTFHKKNPLKPGMPKEEIRTVFKIDPRLFNFVLSGLTDVVAEKDILRSRDFRISLSSSEEEHRAKIRELLEKGAFQPPAKEELSQALKLDNKRLADILGLMSKEGLVVRISDSVYLSSGTYNRMMSLLRDFFSRKTEMSVAEFRDLLNTSRKYALPFLEYLDAQKITIRTGDVRKLMKPL
jgi:selenocysteine-specific elongation factor